MDPVLRRGDVSEGFQQTAKTARFFRVLLAAALLFLTAGTAQAATYYVATTGNDSNAGTETAPFKTIARGSQALSPGDTLLIRAGTYNEAMMHNQSGFKLTSGTSLTAMTRYAAYPGETVILKPSAIAAFSTPEIASYIEVSGLTIDAANTSSNPIIIGTQSNRFGTKYIRFIGNEVMNSKLSLFFVEGVNNEIIGNHIHATDDYGIYARGNAGLIENNLIHDTGGYGLHLYKAGGGSESPNNWVVRNNVFYDNGYEFYHSTDPTTKRQTDTVLIRGTNNQFYNNIIYKSYGGIVVAYGANNTFVGNNTIYGNTTTGIDISSLYGGSSAARVINNISYGNGGSQITNTGTGTVLQNNLTTNPNFVNAAGGDFHLQAGSPAIDAGMTLTEVTNDFDYGPRPWPAGGAYDIGAFEFGSPPGTRPAPPPPSGGGTTPPPPGIGGGMCTIVTTEDVLCAPVGATVPLNIEIETFTSGDNNRGNGNDEDGDDDDNPSGDD